MRAQFRRNNNLLFSHEGSCALWRAAAVLQFAVGWHKALQSAKKSQLRLQTQRDGYDTDTDVRESYEIQEKVQREQWTAKGTLVTSQESGQSARCGMEQWLIVFLVCTIQYLLDIHAFSIPSSFKIMFVCVILK